MATTGPDRAGRPETPEADRERTLDRSPSRADGLGEGRSPRGLRIRTLMLLIAGVAAWLGLWKASPDLGFFATICFGPALWFFRWLDRGVTKEQGGPPGLAHRAFLFVLAFTTSAVVIPIVLAPILILLYILFLP